MNKIFLSISLAIPLCAIEYPSAPVEPTVASPQVEGAEKVPGRKKNKPGAAKVPLINVRIRIHLGDKSVLFAEAELPESYAFNHTKGQLSYNQIITAASIREIHIESYRGRKIAASKEGDVYVFEPVNVRIELKDGQVYRLRYLFKDLRKLKARNSDGNFTVYAFFADTYKPKTGWIERGGDEIMLNTKRAHPAAFVKLEYFEPVDKTGVVKDDYREPATDRK